MANRLSRYLQTLEGKVICLFGMLFVLVFVAMGILFYLGQRSNLMERERKALADTTDLVHGTLNRAMDDAIKNHLRAVAEKTRDLLDHYYRRTLDRDMTQDQAMAAAREVLLDPAFGRVGRTGYLSIVSYEGVLLIHPLSEGVDASGYPFMQQAIRLKNGYFEYDWRNVGENEARPKAAYVVEFPEWRVLVWATCYKSEFRYLAQAVDFAGALGDAGKVAGGRAVILDGQGRLLVAGGEGALEPEVAAAFPPMVAKGDGQTRVSVSGGADRLVRFRRLDRMGWGVAVIRSLEDMRAELRMIGYLALAGVLLGCLVNYLLLSSIFSRLMAPVGAISEVAGAVVRGDLSRRIPIVSKDELGEISRRLNIMLESFETILGRIRQSTGVLADAVQSLSAISQETASTSNQQAASVKEIVSTMEDSDKLARSIAGRINEVAGMANSARDAVTDGFSLIKESLGKMDEIRGANAQRIAGMRSLGERIASIWEIVNIINGIADQIRIIAFNAELEAASAGEAGGNFKIVANEIRRLADGTVASTGQIKSKINEIQHSSDHLILSSEDVTEKIGEGWALSGRLKRVFEDILSSSEIAAGSAEHIALSINQQVATFDQIVQTLKQISEGIDNFVVSTRAMTDASENLQGTAEGLEALIDGYQGDAGNGGQAAESGTLQRVIKD